MHKCARSKRGIAAAIRKYGRDNFSFDIIDEVDNIDAAKQLEIKYVTELNTFMYKDNSNGYNLTMGGDNISPKAGRKAGSRNSDESIEKARQTKIKNGTNFHSDETKDKMRKAKQGKPCPFNLGENNPAKKPESRRKISEKMSQHWIFVDPQGNTTEFDNLRQFCPTHNLSASAMVRVFYGKLKQHKGWTKAPIEAY
jgi:hypothetical protein